MRKLKCRNNSAMVCAAATITPPLSIDKSRTKRENHVYFAMHVKFFSVQVGISFLATMCFVIDIATHKMNRSVENIYVRTRWLGTSVPQRDMEQSMGKYRKYRGDLSRWARRRAERGRKQQQQEVSEKCARTRICE